MATLGHHEDLCLNRRQINQITFPETRPTTVSSKQLAMTGTGTLTIGGVALAGPWILAAALGIVIVGAILVRVAFRRRKQAHQ
jgi:hypothetical protein